MKTDKIISLYQLGGEQRELAEVIGLEAYRKLVERYGGSHIYICKLDTILRDVRNEEIYNKFNGYNYRQLAIEYNLSEKTVREIINEHIKNNEDAQLKLF